MIFLMAGTSDARELALIIQKLGIPLVASVVTQHAGQNLMRAGIDTHVGRLNVDKMCQLLRNVDAKWLIDASHPYAKEAHHTAIASADACHIPYIRYERPVEHYDAYPLVTVVNTYEEAAQIAFERKGSIMLTTGSKTLQIFADKILGHKGARLVARVVPLVENMEKCLQLGFDQTDIVGIQGPFSLAFNREMYRHYKTTLMITKESGPNGSVDEKIKAALEMGIEVVVIARPKISYSCKHSSFDEVIEKITESLEEFRGGL